MARKATVRKADIPKRAIAAALKLATERGWRRVSLHDIAERAGVTLEELYGQFSSRDAILSAFVRGIDAQVLKSGDPEDAAESPRHRLFAVIMNRFDALAPHKPAIAAIMRDCGGDMLTVASSLCRLISSMAWMLEAAGISSAGLRGALRTKGLAAIYCATIRVWLSDDSADMAKTMAALDRHLDCAERFQTRRRGRAPRAGTATA
ncbi:MAG: TetR family transcriptional regulator [Alphaproteobacteria bacterium]